MEKTKQFKPLRYDILVTNDIGNDNKPLLRKENKGRILAIGAKVEEIKVGDIVIYGEKYDKLCVRMDGKDKELLVMSTENVLLVEELV